MPSWLRSFKYNEYVSQNKTGRNNEKDNALGARRHPHLRRKRIYGVY
jgi:hypothetical protein